MSHIFLDKISTSAHMGSREGSGRAQWKSTLVQPVAVPNLAHTGIRSAFTFSGAPVLRPDGAVSAGLKRYINKEFRELPHLTTAYDPLDMAHRDKVKRREKALRIQRKKMLTLKRKEAQKQFLSKQRRLSVAYGGSPSLEEAHENLHAEEG
eukprot:CAMPEP_0118645410 /NCGR_PEP_ID=MMETSP0785-20121206/7490_1 /TAXON_ID=91992 /ORGANISM="Bolidomonas pacifica, Strain CCMP 1866" /LENGTH=150 /DNA_ID=CAMNT_0006537299 /DNA_START=78 /DNA_END=526 /DNA_ORIENTATION=-